MSVERFSAWYFTQPELVQELVVLGPPFLVAAGIMLALGARLRFIGLAWLYNPAIAAAIDGELEREKEEADGEWVESARASVDDLVARQRRGVR